MILVLYHYIFLVDQNIHDMKKGILQIYMLKKLTFIERNISDTSFPLNDYQMLLVKLRIFDSPVARMNAVSLKDVAAVSRGVLGVKSR